MRRIFDRVSGAKIIIISKFLRIAHFCPLASGENVNDESNGQSKNL